MVLWFYIARTTELRQSEGRVRNLMRKKAEERGLLLTIGITYTQALMRGWHVQDAKGKSNELGEVDRGRPDRTTKGSWCF